MDKQQMSDEFYVKEWRPSRGLKSYGLSFFRKTNQKKTWILASRHPSSSITWLWFLQFSFQHKRWFFFYKSKTPSQTGTISFGFLRLFGFMYSWQKRMPYPPQLVCTMEKCNTTISEYDSTFCCKKGCVKREDYDRRALWRAWFKQSSEKTISGATQ